MGCTKCDKVSIKCGDVIYAPCVYFEVTEDLQSYVVGGSSTEPTECTTLDESLEDIYNKLKELEETVDFTGFESGCLELSDAPTLNEIVVAMDEEICDLKEQVEELDDICNILDKNIEDCDLDYSCFGDVNSCDNPLVITSLKDLIQEIINRICVLEAA